MKPKEIRQNIRRLFTPLRVTFPKHQRCFDCKNRIRLEEDEEGYHDKWCCKHPVGYDKNGTPSCKSKINISIKSHNWCDRYQWIYENCNVEKK